MFYPWSATIHLECRCVLFTLSYAGFNVSIWYQHQLVPLYLINILYYCNTRTVSTNIPSFYFLSYCLFPIHIFILSHIDVQFYSAIVTTNSPWGRIKQGKLMSTHQSTGLCVSNVILQKTKLKHIYSRTVVPSQNTPL